jgi:NTP pyrophosphatase (non-canonical NTP hydrolase)
MGDLQTLINKIRQFNMERDWSQFHNAKDLALAISIEAAELNELFLWKKAEDADPEKVKEELADIFTYAIQLADKYGFDINEIISNKIEKNALKYPIEKAKGSARKYNEL